jgi:hypothetical protein
MLTPEEQHVPKELSAAERYAAEHAAPATLQETLSPPCLSLLLTSGTLKTAAPQGLKGQTRTQWLETAAASPEGIEALGKFQQLHLSTEQPSVEHLAELVSTALKKTDQLECDFNGHKFSLAAKL